MIKVEFPWDEYTETDRVIYKESNNIDAETGQFRLQWGV